MAAIAFAFVLAALPILIATASISYHTEVVDSAIVGQHRYIISRHRSHVDVENPPLVILYQCSTTGLYCTELFQSRVYGYPPSYLVIDNTIKLQVEPTFRGLMKHIPII
jgi:hypothetical protein